MTRPASTPSARPIRRWTSNGLAPSRVLSDRDAEAPTLDEVKAAGLLPTWDEAKAFVEELRRRSS